MKTLKEIMAQSSHFHSRSQVTGVVGTIAMLRIDRRIRLTDDCISALLINLSNSEVNRYASLPKPRLVRN